MEIIIMKPIKNCLKGVGYSGGRDQEDYDLGPA
jgi:hypothetical protein